MAAVCEVCGKGPGFGMSVSHSHRRNKRRFNPNIQRVRCGKGHTNAFERLHQVHQVQPRGAQRRRLKTRTPSKNRAESSQHGFFLLGAIRIASDNKTDMNIATIRWIPCRSFVKNEKK